MEQKTTQKSKRQLWSVHVFVHAKDGECRWYLYLEVTRCYQKNGLLCVIVGKNEKHTHEIKRIESVQVRKHRRDDRIV